MSIQPVGKRIGKLLGHAIRLGVDPSAVFGSVSEVSNLVWSFPERFGRVTLYLEPNGMYEVELVPDGPVAPYSTSSESDAIEHVRSILIREGVLE